MHIKWIKVSRPRRVALYDPSAYPKVLDCCTCEVGCRPGKGDQTIRVEQNAACYVRCHADGPGTPNCFGL